METTRNLFKLRVKSQRQIGHQHGRLVFLRGVKRIRDNVRGISCHELDGTGRAARLNPLIFEQVLEEVVTPLGWRLRPDYFQTRGNRICANARAVAVDPAQALRLNRCSFRIDTDVAGRCGTVGFTQRMSTSNQCHDLFVVHAHVAESGANSRGRRGRIAAVFRTFRVHVNQTHFGSAQWRLRQGFRVTVFQPGGFFAPVHIHIRFPDIFTSGTKAEGTESGIFQRDVARQNVEVGPGDLLTIFLFNRPQ